MKKYIKPTMILLEIESEGMMVAISNTNAKEDAAAKGHFGCFDWDDDDYSSESTDSNPNPFDE